MSIDQNFRVVGRVKDAHGLKGEIWVVLFAGVADWLDSLKDDGKYLLSKKESIAGLVMTDLAEFPLKGARAHKNGVILHSTTVKDRTAAEGFKGHFLVIPEEYLVSEEGDSYFLSEIQGFRVLEDKREIGVITGFSHNGAQDLLQVTLVKGVREGVKAKDVIEIPFVKELVVEVDDEGKQIHVELPEGLIEVQLGLDKADAAQERAEQAAASAAAAGEDDDDGEDPFDKTEPTKVVAADLFGDDDDE